MPIPYDLNCSNTSSVPLITAEITSPGIRFLFLPIVDDKRILLCANSFRGEISVQEYLKSQISFRKKIPKTPVV